MLLSTYIELICFTDNREREEKMDGRTEGAANLKADWTSLRRRLRALARAHNRPPDGGREEGASVCEAAPPPWSPSCACARSVRMGATSPSLLSLSRKSSSDRLCERPSERASERPLEQSLKSGWAEEGETGGSDSGNFGQRSMHAHEEECEGASRKRRSGRGVNESRFPTPTMTKK